MRNTLKIFFSATIFVLLFSYVDAQVKTKIFPEGIPTEFLPFQKVSITEKIITAPTEFYSPSGFSQNFPATIIFLP